MSSAAVEVISKETIKPATPTPNLLKNFNLSLLDELNPPIYFPIIFFYPAATSVAISTGSKLHDNLDLLKSCLSETLVQFYPMAGRIKDNIVVDCNDQGVDFIEVKIKGKMCDFMKEPYLPLSQLLPSQVVSTSLVKEAQPQVIIQVNMFDCGGTAICFCISHKIADAATVSAFIRSWASTTNHTSRSGSAIAAPTTIIPSFDSASLFPPSEQMTFTSGSCPSEDTGDDKTVTKRFVFDL
ncbi:hypothetical protein MKW92_014527, partial [Papaver armeniacum]